MAIFDVLPTVEKCCFCISLRWGSFIIGIISLVSLSGAGVSLTQKCLSNNESLKDIITVLFYFAIIVQVLVAVISLVFLIGICLGAPQTATWYLYVISISVIITAVIYVTSAIFGFKTKGCPTPFAEILSAILTLLVWFYFLSVVKSYQPEMGD